MKKSITSPTFRGRFLGVAILVATQLVVGFIHIFFGILMFSGFYSAASFSLTPMVYGVYTFIYGCLTFVFGYLLWENKRSGWIGTVAVSLFVILVDSLTMLNLFDALGIPSVAGIGEIPFSLLVLVYLLQDGVRSKYNI